MERLGRAHVEWKLGGQPLDDFLRNMPDSQPFVVEATTTYTPATNTSIPEEQFDFIPPV